MSTATLPPEAPAIKKLAGSLSKSIEQLLLAGLTAAGKSTQEHLAVSMKEAARMRLLRLGSTIRVVGEEINRFDADAKRFSPQRLSFFLNRTWILCRGICKAIDENDAATLSSLLATPATVAVPQLKLAVIGVSKRVVPGVFYAFDFRMIVLEDAPVAQIRRGQQASWSCVFPAKAGAELPAEAFLQLPQKQGFKPSALLGKRIIQFINPAVSIDTGQVARITLGETSKVELGEDVSNWPTLHQWDRPTAALRVRNASVTPIDLEVELQELVILRDWQIDIPKDNPEENIPIDWPMLDTRLPMICRTDFGESADCTRDAIKKASRLKKDRPAIVGLMHYEACRLIVLPIALLNETGPEYITLKHAQISTAELVKALQLK